MNDLPSVTLDGERTIGFSVRNGKDNFSKAHHYRLSFDHFLSLPPQKSDDLSADVLIYR